MAIEIIKGGGHFVFLNEYYFQKMHMKNWANNLGRLHCIRSLYYHRDADFHSWSSLGNPDFLIFPDWTK